MTQEQKYWINKVWSYTKQTLLHRRAYLVCIKLIHDFNLESFYPNNPHKLTPNHLLELEAIETIINTDNHLDVFIYQKWTENPYADPEWYSMRKTIEKILEDDFLPY